MESIIAPPFQAAFYYMAGCVLSKNKTRPRNFLKIAKNDPGCSLMLFNPRPSLRTLRTLRLPGRALIPPLASPCLATIFKVTLLFSAWRLFELMKNMRGGNLRLGKKFCVKKNIKSELCRLRDKSRLEKG